MYVSQHFIYIYTYALYRAVVVSEDTKVGRLAVFSEDILKELVSSAGLGHIDAVLQPVLM